MRKVWQPIAAIGLACSIVFGAHSAFASSVASPDAKRAVAVSWHRASNAKTFTAPVVEAKVNEVFDELGWAPYQSDAYNPTRFDIASGTTVTYRLGKYRCGQSEGRSAYGIHAEDFYTKMFSSARACLTNIGAHVNEPCGPNQDKQLVARVRVTKGDRVNWGGSFRVRLASGRYLVSPAWLPGKEFPRIVEYYFFPGPKDRVDVRHLRRSTGMIGTNLGAHIVSATLRAACQFYGARQVPQG